MKQINLSKTLLSLTLILSSSIIFAQAPLQWNSWYIRPGAANAGIYPKEANYDVKYLSSGNVIGVGSSHPITPIGSNDLALRKYRSTDGTVIGEYYSDIYAADQDDKAIKLVIKEPYIYVLATSKFGTPSFDDDIVLIKLDTAFNVQWTRIFNGAGNVNDQAIDLGSDIAGNIYIIGNTSRTATGNDLVWLKYAPDGTNLFTKYYSSAGNFPDSAKAMVAEPNGVCDITGTYGSSTHGQRLLALKLWGNGIQLWVKYHDAASATSNADEGNAISYDPVTGDVYIAGKGRNAAGDYDWLVVKFEGVDGTKLWSKKFMGIGNASDAGTGITYTALGELFSCGNITTTVSGVISANIQLRKLNPADGSAILTRTYNYTNAGPVGPTREYARGIISTPAGNVYIFGAIDFPMQTITQAYHLVLGYNSAGVLLWSHEASSGSASGFQDYEGLCASYSNSLGVLYVGGFRNINMVQVGYATMIKFGPVTIHNPEIIERIGSGAPSLSIYPNPATDYVILSGTQDVKAVVEIIDISGRCVLKTACPQSESRIDISSLAGGTYIARYITGTLTETYKFIKQQ